MTKLTENLLPSAIAGMVKDQLAKGQRNGKEENSYLYANPLVLLGKAVQKAAAKNWPAAITYLAMAAAAWYSKKDEEELESR